MGTPNPYGGQPYGMPSQPYGAGGPPGAGGKTNGLSVASLIFGILWLCGVGSIAAVILGHIALAQIKRTGAAGRGLAIAGLVLGYLGVAGGIITLLLFIGAAANNGSGAGPSGRSKAPYANPESAAPARSGTAAKVTIETCLINEVGGFPAASGVLSNATGREASFKLRMRFSRADGTVLGTGDTNIDNVPAGGKKKYQVADLGVGNEKGSITCEYRIEER